MTLMTIHILDYALTTITKEKWETTKNKNDEKNGEAKNDCCLVFFLINIHWAFSFSLILIIIKKSQININSTFFDASF